MGQPESLISLLLDPSASVAERDDAAMDLAAFTQPEAEHALLKVALGPSTPELVVASCGESLAEIWCRRAETLPEAFSNLPDVAKHEARGYIQQVRPDWLA
ncbi:MAG: hypothetical protein R3B13_21420 [Polyangiaceae bacterium]